MSGDLQPRKRKDKKKKNKEDDEASSHGVHITKMGNDDVHLHVQHNHDTGGHLCAKILFFSLMAVLLGLVGLIIVENRGLSDLDTPLSKSRFSNYFEGWVEENREEEHDHHSIESHHSAHDDHDDGDEPFEEEEDHSDDDDHESAEKTEEADDEEHDDEEHDDEDDDEGDGDEDDDIVEGDDEENNESGTIEESEDAYEVDAEADTEADDESNDQNEAESVADDDDDDNDNDNEEDEDEGDSKTETLEEENDDDDDNDDGNNDDDDDDDDHDDNNNDDETQESVANDNSANDDNDNADSEDDDNNNNIEDEAESKEQSDGADFVDSDFDNNFDDAIDNDAEELQLLEEKARQQQAKTENQDVNDEVNSEEQVEGLWGFPIAVKIGVGVALGLVARLVLLRNNRNENNKPKEGHHSRSIQEDNNEEMSSFERDLRQVNDEIMQDNYAAGLRILTVLEQKYADQPIVFLAKAQCLDHLAKNHQNDIQLSEVLQMYKRYLAFDTDVSTHKEYFDVIKRCIEIMYSTGSYIEAVSLQKILIENFPDDRIQRNKLAITYLMLNRLSEAKIILDENLHRWPQDGLALAYYGYVLSMLDKDYNNAIKYLQSGLNSKAEGTIDGRLYITLGDALQRMNRQKEALTIYSDGVRLQLFPSIYQRSLYNVNRLRAQPFWSKTETSHAYIFDGIEQHWKMIRDEALNAFRNTNGNFLNEAEGLSNIGQWQLMQLYDRGKKDHSNCLMTPQTCELIERLKAHDCNRGQIKFSILQPGTHIWPHCGPTNCRLRAHLGLVVPPKAHIRVADEERSWREGEFLIFDDSFEHEVWNNDTKIRLLLIVDLWHPDLSEEQRKILEPI